MLCQMYTEQLNSQNELLLKRLNAFYKDKNYLNRMLSVISGSSKISLRIVDWFSTNYSKKNFTMYDTSSRRRFKVYEDYKLKLKAYSKKRFDPFCRWERIQVPVSDDSEYCFETTIGQLNFFKWAIENGVLDYIEQHYDEIESDMNSNNSLSKTRKIKTKHKDCGGGSTQGDAVDGVISTGDYTNTKTRKKREELSVSAVKTIKTEHVEITVTFE